MALTDTENLYNLALGLVGGFDIEEGETTTPQYLACERFYPSARDETLSIHLWNEATQQDDVLQDTTSPLFDYEYQYSIPSDCLRILSIGTDLVDWVVVGGKILTDFIIEAGDWASGEDYVAGQYKSYESVTYLCNTSHTSAVASRPDTDAVTWTTTSGDYGYIDLTYIKQLTDIDSFSPTLKNAIVYALAIKISTPLTKNPKVRQGLIEEFRRIVLPEARSLDAQQGRMKPIYNSSWLRSRI
jgi:hypothetical protein